MVSEDPSVIYGTSHFFHSAEFCLVPVARYLTEHLLESVIVGAFGNETMFFQEWKDLVNNVSDSVDL